MTFKRVSVESGRSLTEMLGVLAIMGILAIVGVKMFHSAMERHQANELIYEAQKRATMVAMQITAGQKNLSVAEFQNPEGYTFGTPLYIPGDKTFMLPVTGVEPSICAQMKVSVGDQSKVAINDDCTSVSAPLMFTFNADLSSGVINEQENPVEEACPSGSSVNGKGGKIGISTNAGECKCDHSGEYYTQNGCEIPNQTCTSWTENECGKGRYCNFDSSTYIINGSCDGWDNYSRAKNYYESVGEGVCTDIIAPSSLTQEQRFILRSAGFKNTLERGTSDMSWWSAASWCVGRGKHLVNVADIECYRSGNTLVQSGHQDVACCKQGYGCSSWGSLWNGQSIIPGKENDVAKFSDKLVAIKKIYAGGSWLGSSYGNTNQASCHASGVFTGAGTVSGSARYSKVLPPLCQ